MTASDRLRAAAQKIRDTAGVAERMQPSWEDFARSCRYDGTGAHVALWSPPVALAVADWLEDIAADKDSGLACIHPRALDVADLILGDTE